MRKNRLHSFEAMFELLTITYLLLHINSIDQCAGDSHSITGLFTNSEKYSDGRILLDRILFVRNTTSPKSYVVGFKYVEDAFSRIIYCGTIHSDAQNTNGGGDLRNEASKRNNHYLNANIHIPNATNFQVDMNVRGSWRAVYAAGSFFRPRSLALICAIDKSHPQTKYRQLIFGKRKSDDFIVYARKIFTSADKEMPRHKIEFQDYNVNITVVEIKLNSTRAIVFRNKVQLTEHHFSGTIYGLNRNAIAAIVIIYGHKSDQRSRSFIRHSLVNIESMK